MVWKTNFDRYLEDYVISSGTRSRTDSLFGLSPQPQQQGPGQLQPHAEAAASGPPFLALPAPAPAPPQPSHSQPVPSLIGAAGSSAPGQRQQQQQYTEQRSQPKPAHPPVSIQGRTATARDDLEYEFEVPPPLNLSDLPDSLSATLQHIVGQLDVLTQTLALMDERLTMNEDRVRRIDERLDEVAAAGDGKGRAKQQEQSSRQEGGPGGSGDTTWAPDQTGGG